MPTFYVVSASHHDALTCFSSTYNTMMIPLPQQLFAALILCISFSKNAPYYCNAFSCVSDSIRHPPTPSKSALQYASVANAKNDDTSPMSKVDSSKSGGCPFLDTSYVYKTYAVPALFSEEDSRPIVLFDGECNLCNGFVQTLLKYDVGSDDEPRGHLRFAALQSRVGELLVRRMSDELRAQVLSTPSDGEEDNGGETDEKYKSIVVCGADKTYIRSSAVFRILSMLNGPSKRLKVIQYLALL